MWHPTQIFRWTFKSFAKRIFFVVEMKTKASFAISSTCFFPNVIDWKKREYGMNYRIAYFSKNSKIQNTLEIFGFLFLTVWNRNTRGNHVLIINRFHFVDVMFVNMGIKMFVECVQQSDDLNKNIKSVHLPNLHQNFYSWGSNS